jgi:N-acetylneuraminic acid mutarotase
MNGLSRLRVFAALFTALALNACGGGGYGSDNPAPLPMPTTGWRTLAQMPLGPRQENGVVELNGEIYVIGGFDETQAIVSEVEAYDSATNTWRQAASIPTPLHHVNVAAARGRIYVVGALRNPEFIATGITLEYDPAANTWTQRTPMPAGTERGASAVAALNDLIYVAGGLRNGASVDDFSVYDPASDTWQNLQNMPTARDHFVGAPAGGRFFGIGGRNQSGLRAEVEIYDPQSATWSAGSPMPTARGGCMGAAVNGRIFVVGGEGASAATAGVFNNNEAYDPSANSWTTLESMARPRHGTGAVGLNGALYVPGGADREGFGAVNVNDQFVP